MQIQMLTPARLIASATYSAPAITPANARLKTLLIPYCRVKPTAPSDRIEAVTIPKPSAAIIALPFTILNRSLAHRFHRPPERAALRHLSRAPHPGQTSALAGHARDLRRTDRPDRRCGGRRCQLRHREPARRVVEAVQDHV